MSDYGGAISLSQGRDLSANDSDDDSDHHSPSILASSGRRRPSSSKLMIVSSSKGGGNTSGADQEGSNSSKKPRGRPPGSKNKPKPPIVITRDGDGGMKPVILEVEVGADVVESVVEYARRNRVGISLLSGTGSVSNITLRHPMTHAPTLSLHGTYHLLCLCGSYLTPAATKPNSPSATFGLTVAGQQGQVFGGIVAGNVTAATTVVVVAATYVNPAYHRLPVMEGEDGGGGGSEEQCGGAATATTSGAGMTMGPYSIAAPMPVSCQMSPEVMTWGPTSRAPY